MEAVWWIHIYSRYSISIVQTRTQCALKICKYADLPPDCKYVHANKCVHLYVAVIPGESAHVHSSHFKIARGNLVQALTRSHLAEVFKAAMLRLRMQKRRDI